MVTTDATGAGRRFSAIGETIVQVSKNDVQNQLTHQNLQPIFVGRKKELELASHAVDEACAGRGSVVLLAGEPGIGKTRLAEEMDYLARLRGAMVLWGRCYEGGSAPAFWPWIQVMRSYLRWHEPGKLRSENPFAIADLARLVPELGGPASPYRHDDVQARFQLFDSISQLLVYGARTQPIVIVLDDLHWADAPSLLLLQYVAHELRANPILVVGAYRDTEVRSGDALARSVVELNRVQTCQTISLRGLPAADIVNFIEINSDASAAATLIDRIVAATAGNPFFIGALLRAQVVDPIPFKSAHDRSIPPTVRGVILQRLDRLSASCRTLLDVGAVIGRDFSFNRIRRLSILEPEPLLSALDEALGAQLIEATADAPGQYHFVHDLVRETIYAAMPTADRVKLHHRIGATWEALYAANLDEHLAELCYHFGQAALIGGYAKAVDYAIRAADASARLLAYEEACKFYLSALQLLALQEDADLAQRCILLLALGHVQSQSGETTDARTTYAQAAELARKSHSVQHFAQAALGFAGSVVTPGLVDQQTVALLTEAIEMLGAAGTALRARLMGRLAMEYRYAPLPERRESLSRAAINLARGSGELGTLLATLNARHFALLGPDTLAERMEISAELAELAARTGDWELVLRSLPWRVADLLDQGDVAGADQAIAAADQLASDLRQPLFYWYVTVMKALRALMAGEFARGEALALLARNYGNRVQSGAADVYHGAQLWALRREQDRIVEIEQPLLDIAARYPAMPVIQCMLALVDWQSGRFAEAQTKLHLFCENGCSAIPKDQLWLGSIAMLAEIACDIGDRSAAATLYSLLLPYAQRTIVVGVPICLGSAATYLGRLAAVLQDWASSSAHFDAALEHNARLGAKPYYVRTCAYYGAMLLRGEKSSDRAAGEAYLKDALAAAQALGMSHLVRQFEPLRSGSTSRRPSVANPNGLTPREMEVLRLIAAGKSTKEIASALVISIPTVERHITHIYEKLDTRSRADATAYALRHDLI